MIQDRLRILFLIRDDGNMTEPMGVMLLSAIAKQHRAYCDTFIAVLSHDDVVERVKTLRPHIVVSSMITGSHQDYLEANRAIKKKFPDVVTIAGGPHATFNPQIIHTEPLDALCAGEGDYAWNEFIDAFEAGRPYDDIKNIVTQSNASRVLAQVKSHGSDMPSWRAINLSRPLTGKELDALPYMDRALVYDNTPFGHRTKRTMMTSRGCPFICTYCFEGDFYRMYRKSVGSLVVFQRMSVERVIAELEEMVGRYHTTFIKFYDDIFTAHKGPDQWIADFADQYPRRVGLPFHFLTRTDLLDEWPLKKFIVAGLDRGSMTMSIEAGNAWIRENVMERKMSEEDIRLAFTLCEENKVRTFTNIIFGVPVPKDVMKEHGMRPIDYDIQSVKMCMDMHVSWVECPVLFPYGGTPMYGYLVERGFFSGNLDELGLSYQGESPLTCFTHEEKMQQLRLSLLGPVVTLFSGSHSRIMQLFAKPVFYLATKVFIYVPMNKAYLLLFNAVRNWIHLTRIYPPGKKLGIVGTLQFIKDNLILDWAKRFKNQKRVVRSGELTLGGLLPAPAKEKVYTK